MAAGGPGAPSKYQDSYAEQAEKLCELGATDEDLANFFNVSIRTVLRWKVEHSRFCQAVKLGKKAIDDRVERSLFQRAVGYSFDSVHFSNHKGKVTATPYVKHVPPDVTAQIFWLKNRRPEQWREKIDHTVSGEVGHVGEVKITLVSPDTPATEDPPVIDVTPVKVNLIE